jgi:hypothetical protein
VTVWPKEDVPNGGNLYLRVHVNLVPDGKLHPNVFREQQGSMSTDWEKYSTPEETQARTGEPEKNGVVALVAGGVRGIGLQVEHSPDVQRNNRAHTDVTGIGSGVRKTTMRAKLFQRFNQWLIKPQVQN